MSSSPYLTALIFAGSSPGSWSVLSLQQLNSIVINFHHLGQLLFALLSFLPFHSKSKLFHSASMIQHYPPDLFNFFAPLFPFLFILKYLPCAASSSSPNSWSCCFPLLVQPPGLTALSSVYSFLKTFGTSLSVQNFFFPPCWVFPRVLPYGCAQRSVAQTASAG